MARMAWSWFLLEIMAIKPTYWLIATGVFGLVFLLSLIKTSIKVALARGLMIAYVFLMVICTTLNREISAETYNLVPFWSYRAYFVEGHKDVITQAFLNVVMFIPYGALCAAVVGSYFKSKSTAFNGTFTVITALILSVAIEVTQLITHKGLCETDDVIHNALGALIGYSIWQLYRKIKYKHDAGTN